MATSTSHHASPAVCRSIAMKEVSAFGYFDQAFSALKESGNVISWGNESDGGCSRHAHVFFFGWVESR